jgi:hypothetical protein
MRRAVFSLGRESLVVFRERNMSTRWSLVLAPAIIRLGGLGGWIFFAGMASAQGPAQGPPPPAAQQARPQAAPIYNTAPPQAAPKASAWFPRLDGQLLRNADGAAVGQVTLVTGNQLVIASVGSAPLVLRMDANLPVFEGESDLSRGPGKLRPGTDVKAYYRRDAGQVDPRTVAVVILDPQTAQAISPRQAPDSTTVVGRQPGRVVSFSNGILEIDPYEEAAGNARVTLGPGAIVARGTHAANTSALRPGAEVMVTYRSAPDGHPIAVRVDLLSSDEAAKLRRDYARVPAQRRPPL